jgi:hypothetical protein
VKILLLLPLLLCAPAFASQTLSDASYLRKLSLHIRGTKPTRDEYDQLRQTRGEAEKNSFFEQFTNNLLASKGHQGRMQFRLAERFRLQTPERDLKAYEDGDKWGNHDGGQSISGKVRDSLIDLFSRIARDNLSWDELLTGKSYTAYPSIYSKYEIEDTDFSFYKNVHAKLKNIDKKRRIERAFLPPRKGNPSSGYTDPTDVPIKIEFAKDDLRIAGALTTRRFLSRYNTTGLNKNRRRAAAVFKIFLCDAMIPAISDKEDRTHEFLDATFARDFEVTANELSGEVTEQQRHGTDPQCMACHSKLDPLGRAFQALGNTMHPRPFGGHLYFKRSSHSTVFLKGRGIGDLAKAISQQPEYEQCQVQWFWDEFIGVDIPLSNQRKNELVLEFNRVNRRTNDFISILVKQPEFRSKPRAKGFITFSQVQPLLKRCDSCHAGMEEIPLFASPSTPLDNDWQKNILDRLNRGDNDDLQMPQDLKETWRGSDIQLIKQWILDGARKE